MDAADVAFMIQLCTAGVFWLVVLLCIQGPLARSWSGGRRGLLVIVALIVFAVVSFRTLDGIVSAQPRAQVRFIGAPDGNGRALAKFIQSGGLGLRHEGIEFSIWRRDDPANVISKTVASDDPWLPIKSRIEWDRRSRRARLIDTRNRTRTVVELEF